MIEVAVGLIGALLAMAIAASVTWLATWLPGALARWRAGRQPRVPRASIQRAECPRPARRRPPI